MVVVALSAILAGPLSCKGGSCSGSPGAHTSRPDSGIIRRTMIIGRETAPTDIPGEMSASQILVSHMGAEGATPWVKRSRKEALARAATIAARVRKAPGTFAAEAIKESDGPHRREGGHLRPWRRGKMMPAFERAVARLPAGGISGPVETIFGFHIIQRHRVLPSIKISASHLLVTYKGAFRARASVTRTREEARSRAARLLASLTANPDQFDRLVREQSDGPRAQRGGPMGFWTVGRNNKPPVFDRVLSALNVGQVASEVVESPFGFHIFKRTRFKEPTLLSASHILIAYKGATRCPIKVRRSREEALALARKLARRLRAQPYRFTELAQKHSDDPEGKRGGHLGTWAMGTGVAEFEAAVLLLEVGKVSPPVETLAGFHIIRRHAVQARPKAR